MPYNNGTFSPYIDTKVILINITKESWTGDWEEALTIDLILEKNLDIPVD
mgnify:CR=1 FL=1